MVLVTFLNLSTGKRTHCEMGTFQDSSPKEFIESIKGIFPNLCKVFFVHNNIDSSLFKIQLTEESPQETWDEISNITESSTTTTFEITTIQGEIPSDQVFIVHFNTNPYEVTDWESFQKIIPNYNSPNLLAYLNPHNEVLSIDCEETFNVFKQKYLTTQDHITVFEKDSNSSYTKFKYNIDIE